MDSNLRIGRIPTIQFRWTKLNKERQEDRGRTYKIKEQTDVRTGFAAPADQKRPELSDYCSRTTACRMFCVFQGFSGYEMNSMPFRLFCFPKKDT